MADDSKSPMADVPIEFNRRDAPSAVARLQQSAFLILVGAPSLELLHQISENKERWPQLKQLLTDRTTNVTVVGALLVASCASFITTPPPTDISSWHPQFPYVCMLGAYGCAMLSIVFGFIQILFLGIIGPGDIKAAQTSTSKSVALFMLLMMPLALLLLSACCAGVGYMGAIWLGNVLWLKVFMSAGYAVLLLILFLIMAALY
ncbi:hypothetical protein EDC04DRAFT_2834108 [Pisolithus marmoratus]|nr:hypothetical protein EDC04DRAFT_2834108 [Pisolithus marmoratus]